MVTVTVLGEQSVVDPVTERIVTRSTRSIALVGLLVAHTGSPQTRAGIAGTFWPASTSAQALTNLRRELHQLRRLVPDETLEVTPTHLCWHDHGRHRVDLGVFLREQAAAVASDDDHGVLAHGAAALEEYAGDLLPGLDEPWLDDDRARLRALCVRVCDAVSAAAVRIGRLDLAVDAVRRRIGVDAYDEPAHRRLMELQAANGDRAGAVRTYHRLTRLLERDLGVEPDPETRATLARLMRGSTGPRRPGGTSARTRPGLLRAPLVGRDDRGERSANARTPSVTATVPTTAAPPPHH